MHPLRSLLPSSNALFTFEAAARQESFTAAARELNVSQPAVSKAILQLERHLDVTLFHRRHRSVALTDEGRRFYQEVASAFDHLHGAAEALQRAPVRQSLTVSFSSIFVSSWLVPKIARFKAQHPDLRIHVEINDREDKNLAREGIDLSMRLGDGHWAGLDAWFFAEELVYPVCAPALLEGKSPIDLSDLFNLPLLHLQEHYRVRIGWTEWLHQAGLPNPRLDHDWVFTDAQALLQAALAGQGLALGWDHLVKDLVREGKLLRPVSANYRSGLGLHIIAPQSGAMKWGARQFRDWLLDEVGRNSDLHS